MKRVQLIVSKNEFHHVEALKIYYSLILCTKKKFERLQDGAFHFLMRLISINLITFSVWFN